MTIASFFANLIPPGHKIWPVIIEVEGHTVQATGFEENAEGMWHVSYEKPGTFKEYRMKWITPTAEQISARGQ